MELLQLFNIKRIKQEYVILFDLDGTLLDTDMANNGAYLYAIKQVLGNDSFPELSYLKRITRKDVAVLDGINETTLNEIIDKKKWAYRNQLKWGNSASIITTEILKRHFRYNKCYIVTSAEKSRAELLIRGYGLDTLIKDVIYANSENKYCGIADKIGVDANKIILLEDNKDAIANAIKNGVLEHLIVNVGEHPLKKHIIKKNDFLNVDIYAYYSLYYLGYGKHGNPNFINDIKNQFNSYSGDILLEAYKVLIKYLKRDITYIYNVLGISELTIVGIPRAKAEGEYSPNQQLFRRGISYTVELLIKQGLNLIDGSHYILRHTNTKTTHLAKNPNVENDGALPYVGITKDTCNISDQVEGKDILLIDDIYTKTVNIDEDAIQALYDKGAKSVTFYSICRTL
ncbi:MAG: HAD hydrolase-like protein [Paludibacteraceae bacterium]|nr:HAD hydrolase-like protein [Paludibacteraceae bacterium]